MFAELTICVLTRECPVNGSVLGIAEFLPNGDLVRQSGFVGQSPVPALAAKRRDSISAMLRQLACFGV